jgi:hypothetical protein
MISFTNASKKWAGKTQLVVDYLSRHGLITAFIAGRPCTITLNQTVNPASVIDRGNHVEIELADWYFEQYPIGYVLGMLCHEFAVHPMADADGLPDFEEGLLNEALETGLEGLTVVAARAGQQDHIFASARGMPRNRIYRDVVLEMAVLLAEEDMRLFFATDKGGSGVADLIDCYLMDVASILGTNDHRQKGVGKASTIASLYNLHREDLLTLMRGDKRYGSLPKHVNQKDKGAFNVFSNYTSVGGNLLLGKVCTSCIISKEESERERRKFEARVRPVIGNMRVFDRIGNDEL